MKKTYKDKSMKSPRDKQVEERNNKMVFNFPPTVNTPAMAIEAATAREAEEIYRKKTAATLQTTNQTS